MYVMRLSIIQAGIDGRPGRSAYSVSLRKRRLARPAPAASRCVALGWLAAERLWPTRASQGL